MTSPRRGDTVRAGRDLQVPFFFGMFYRVVVPTGAVGVVVGGPDLLGRVTVRFDVGHTIRVSPAAVTVEVPARRAGAFLRW